MTLESQARAVVARRRGEQAAVIEQARAYAELLAEHLDLVAAVLGGSYARGDFNRWSDIDLLVIAGDLPERFLDRQDRFRDAPAGFEVIALTPAEYQEARRRKNRMILDAPSGILLTGTLPE